MNEIFIYFTITVAIVAAIINRRSTKQIYRRADTIQKSLNEYIEKERKHNAK